MEAPVDSMHARRKPLKDRRPEGEKQGFSLPLPSRMTHMAPVSYTHLYCASRRAARRG